MNKGILGFKVFRCRKPACKAVAIISAFAMLSVGAFPALAGGVSGQVLDNVNGGASIIKSTDNVTMSGGGSSATLSLLGGKSGLIDWSVLNVGNGQSLSFQGGDFYNVVQGGNASQIAGTLKASGSLWIFNPAGISFINGAQVDVGGVFSAAAAGLANHDEMFKAINDSYAAYVANPEKATWDVPAASFGAAAGNVKVESGTTFNGNVSLLGRQVSVSEGATFNGDLNVTAASGQTDVDEVSGGKVSISINDFADVDSDINVTFEAATGELAGRPLKVSGDLNVIADGSIYVQGAVKADGDIAFKTVAKPGSEIVVDHKQISVASGKLLQGKSVSASAAGKITVDGSVSADDGAVDLSAIELIEVFGDVSGKSVTANANRIGQFGMIDVSAMEGNAGTVDLHAADALVVGSGSKTLANAGENGNGGTVTLVGENYGNFQAGAVIEAKGGSVSGDGGFVETSGYRAMNLAAKVDTTAANGKTGILLIDPYNLTISDAPDASVPPPAAGDPYTPSDESANLNVDTLKTALETTSVTVQTTDAGGAGSEAGDIIVASAIDYSGSAHNDLTLDAYHDVKVNAEINAGAHNLTLRAGNDIEQTTGNKITANDLSLQATGKATMSGDVEATKITSTSDVSLSGTVNAEKIDAAGKTLTQDGDGTVTVTGADGITAATVKQTAAGTIKAAAINGTLEQNNANGLIQAIDGDLTLNGNVHQNAGTIQASHLTLKNGDVIQADDAAKIKTDELTFDNSKKIALVSNNNEIDKLSGNLSELNIADKDDLLLGQLSVGGSLKVKTGGSTKIDGKVSVGSSADIDAGQNVEFSSGGQLAASSAKVKAGANITQAGASVSVSRGYVNTANLTAAIQSGSTDLTAGGNIGNGTYNYVTVGGGTVNASAGGDASIASAGSENLRVSSVSGANVSLYTAGKLITEGSVTSRGNTTVTAKEFGGIAQSSFGSSLTVNNFNNGARPLLAIFETKGGNKTPKINNQPNDTIVFIDGRLAGGDIQIINKLGALEAFPVQTPELKSEQGVFGNPNFLHDELDVANPFAVGAIDFLLQDVPLLTLTSDFPTEVDKQVAANGLNPTTSYWFGQNPQAEEPEKKDEAEKEAKKKEGSSNDAVK